MINDPLVDLTTINAIESVFHKGPSDPFGIRLAADFADLFIFSDSARFAVTRPTDAPESEKYGKIPQLVHELSNRDQGSLREAPLYTGNLTVNEEYLEDSFASFSSYVNNNSQAVKDFILLHNSPDIRVRPPYKKGVNTGWVFPTHKVTESSSFDALVKLLKVNPEDICHVFDMVLKYSLYGELVGEDAHYLAHPFRTQQTFPTMSRDQGVAPQVPFRCGPSIMSIGGLSRDEYTAILHEARGLARDMKLTDLKPGALEKERLREFAAKLELPPRLKEGGRAVGLGGGIIATVSALPVLDPSVAIIGGLISIAASFWTTHLPRAASRLKWLHWTLAWDLEKQGR